MSFSGLSNIRDSALSPDSKVAPSNKVYFIKRDCFKTRFQKDNELERKGTLYRKEHYRVNGELELSRQRSIECERQCNETIDDMVLIKGKYYKC